MDPKNAQTLDPKLKEAYDRVMGATLPSTPPQPAPIENIHIPPTHDPLDKMATRETTPPVHTPPVHQSQIAATSPLSSTPLHVSSGFVAQHEEKKPAVSGTLLIIAGVIFLLVYTLFWLKWFGVALPFLP